MQTPMLNLDPTLPDPISTATVTPHPNATHPILTIPLTLTAITNEHSPLILLA